GSRRTEAMHLRLLFVWCRSRTVRSTKMRKIAMVAVFVGLFSGAAQAQGVATQNVNLTATVGGYCTIDGGPTGVARSGTVPVANGVVTPGSLPIGTDSNVICTQNATIQLTSTNAGLTNSATVVPPF